MTTVHWTGKADIEASIRAWDKWPISRWYEADIDRWDALHRALESTDSARR